MEIGGKNYGTSKVTQGLARHSLEESKKKKKPSEPHEPPEHGGGGGGGHESMTVTKKPEGGYETHNHATGEKMHHGSLHEVHQHMQHHFGDHESGGAPEEPMHSGMDPMGGDMSGGEEGMGGMGIGPG